MKRLTLFMCLALSATLLAACGEDGGSQNLNSPNPTNNTNTNTNNTNNTANVANGGRLLASQCFQCHGTNGHSRTGIDSLVGETANEIISEMREMKASTENDIMHSQAKGYTDTEIQLLAAYLASLK
ncbi:c-type cytochrome [Thiolinea disciformis]|uniref:c-type cytochrome n=1 Tax=Thiolinea disciformis TaxID=125614 RepID=UPI00036CC3EF|nr:c-type cytochrome [Thiolinea disciformis]